MLSRCDMKLAVFFFFVITLPKTAAIGNFQIRFTATVNSSIEVCLNDWDSIAELPCKVGKKKMNIVKGEPAVVNFLFTRIWQGPFSFEVISSSSNQPVTKDRLSKSGSIPSGHTWSDPLWAVNESIRVDYRFQCTRNWYGSDCSHYCVSNAYSTCTSDGSKKCKEGYQGSDCQTPVCPNGCGRGRCISPGMCQCQKGYNGTNCEQCIPLRGCQNGGCASGRPNTCECKQYFVGTYCDKDLRSCMLSPCQNGGICSIQPSGMHTCRCPAGFTGAKCEKTVKNKICSNYGICRNGGRCLSMGPQQFKCQCRKGFGGEFCMQRIMESESESDIAFKRPQHESQDVTNQLSLILAFCPVLLIIVCITLYYIVRGKPEVKNDLEIQNHFNKRIEKEFYKTPEISTVENEYHLRYSPNPKILNLFKPSDPIYAEILSIGKDDHCRSV